VKLSSSPALLVRTGRGVLFLGMLVDGLSVLGLQSFDEQTFTDVAILLALGFQLLVRRPQR
jgi:ribose/xylose/arabinose/galactoside ABC-type transport system permease subunit